MESTSNQKLVANYNIATGTATLHLPRLCAKGIGSRLISCGGGLGLAEQTFGELK